MRKLPKAMQREAATALDHDFALAVGWGLSEWITNNQERLGISDLWEKYLHQFEKLWLLHPHKPVVETKKMRKIIDQILDVIDNDPGFRKSFAAGETIH